MSEISTFNDKQCLYLDWLAISKYERKPATEQLLAKELNVTDRTLRRWKKLPGFREAITERARKFLGEALPEIYGALRREAIKGSFQHIKLALEVCGEHTDRINAGIFQGQPVFAHVSQELGQADELEAGPEVNGHYGQNGRVNYGTLDI